eukprot:GFYU01006446.1.p1 GENE.GFYU01006446.1~~GFYU01006446.1.p1  ORF type:complete len:152 (-),score=3.51 GFYU01006446.1:574-1029(-)
MSWLSWVQRAYRRASSPMTIPEAVSCVLWWLVVPCVLAGLYRELWYQWPVTSTTVAVECRHPNPKISEVKRYQCTETWSNRRREIVKFWYTYELSCEGISGEFVSEHEHVFEVSTVRTRMREAIYEQIPGISKSWHCKYLTPARGWWSDWD